MSVYTKQVKRQACLHAGISVQLESNILAILLLLIVKYHLGLESQCAMLIRYSSLLFTQNTTETTKIKTACLIIRTEAWVL